MPVTIPLRNDLPHFDLEVLLDGATYRMAFYWNTRESFWYMDLYTDEDVPIITSVKVVIDLPLGRRTANPLRPNGAFFAVDTSGERRDPGYNAETQTSDLGDRIQIIYVSADELPIKV